MKIFVYTACSKGKRNEYQGFRYRFLVKAVSLHRDSDSIETEQGQGQEGCRRRIYFCQIIYHPSRFPRRNRISY